MARGRMIAKTLTHRQLIWRAEAWLKKVKRCAVVFTERGCADERADAIGWDYQGESYLIECKASLADFRYDQSKPHRKNGVGFGLHRYYMAQAGVVAPASVDQAWGFLEVHHNQVRVYEAHQRREPSEAQRIKEMRVLIARLAAYQGYYEPPPSPVECEEIGEAHA